MNSGKYSNPIWHADPFSLILDSEDVIIKEVTKKKFLSKRSQKILIFPLKILKV